MYADRGDLAGRPLEPNAREALDSCRLDSELGRRFDERLLEIAHVLLHVLAVALQIQDGVAHELARSVERGLAAAVRFDDLHLRFLRNVELPGVGAPSQRHDGRMLEEDDGVGDRALRDRTRERPLQLPRLSI